MQSPASKPFLYATSGPFSPRVAPPMGRTNRIGGRRSKTPPARQNRCDQSYQLDLNASGRTPQCKRSKSLSPRKSRELSARKSSQKKTPHIGDRFIPSRGPDGAPTLHDMRQALQADRSLRDPELQEQEDVQSPSLADDDKDHKAYHKSLIEKIYSVENPEKARILNLKREVPKTDQASVNNLRLLYSGMKGSRSTAKKKMRHIPSQSDQILDAPSLRDDFYLSLLDWSSSNLIAIALDRSVYVWNSTTGSIHVASEEEEGNYVSAVKWKDDGRYLAIGTSAGYILLFDVETQRIVRRMPCPDLQCRIGTLSWRGDLLSSGALDSVIRHHDASVREHCIGSIAGTHLGEVCGLTWSPDGRLLASGGNDNLVNLWMEGSTGAHLQEARPLFRLSGHVSAVKALSWCPFRRQVLASGGGSADRTIRVWDTSVGKCSKVCDTGSQVSALLWSKEYEELTSGQGFNRHQVSIWKYPNMELVTELLGHTERVLAMAMSPDGEVVASAAADETIRLWRCFEVDSSLKKKTDVCTKLFSNESRADMYRSMR